jgi:hypothetical protein
MPIAIIDSAQQMIISEFNSQKKKPYQVFFLPEDDVINPQQFVAFCPFTLVYAEGCTIVEASKNWIQEVKGKHRGSFSVPTYLHTTRKVWYGTQSGTNIPVYVISFNFSSQAIAFCPRTKQILLGRMEEWKELQGDSSEFIPSMWTGNFEFFSLKFVHLSLDLRITCTPLLESFTNVEESKTLTPHYIN